MSTPGDDPHAGSNGHTANGHADGQEQNGAIVDNDGGDNASGLEELKGRIVVYSIKGCPHCATAKATLREKKLPFTDVSVDRFPVKVREWLKDRTGKSSVPQIFFNDVLVGGNDQLQELVKNQQEFDKLLSEVREKEVPDGDEAPMLPHPGEAIDIPSIDGEKFRCEPDEYAKLVAEMKKAGFVKTHRAKGGWLRCLGKPIKDSFTGKEFVDWCVDKKMMTRDRAIFTGRQLVSRRFGVNVETEADFRDDANALYKLATSDDGKSMNADEISECVQRPAGEVADDLRKLTLVLFSEFLSPDGKSVDYKGIGQSKAFETYKRMTMELQRVDLSRLTREEKLAFFINVYNALVIHATVDKGTPSNLWQRFRFFSTMAYNIGGRVFSLNDMENGVLRSNKGSMATLWMRPFSKDDPRFQVALPEVDARIHFALNCGAKSCPPIKTFSAKDIDAELDLATESYLEGDDALKIDLSKSERDDEDDKNKDSDDSKSNSSKSDGEGDADKEKGEMTEEVKNVLNDGGEEKKDGEDGEPAKKKVKIKERQAESWPQSTVHLSKLFKWYQSDFGEDKEDVLGWIHDRLPDKNEKKAQIAEILRRLEEARDFEEEAAAAKKKEEEEGGVSFAVVPSPSQVYRVKYIAYDWGNNAKENKK